jgi:hypothetical protein
LADTRGYMVGRRIFTLVGDTRGVRKQQLLFPLGFPVIKLLIVRKGLGCVYDMDHAGHVRVNQANKLEIAGARERYRIGWCVGRILIQ